MRLRPFRRRYLAGRRCRRGVADMIGREVEQHPNVRVGQPVVDAPPVASGAHHVRGPQQAHGLGHDVLADADDLSQVAHAQLTTEEERVENGNTRRIAQESEQLRGLDVRFPVRQSLPQAIQRNR